VSLKITVIFPSNYLCLIYLSTSKLNFNTFKFSSFDIFVKKIQNRKKIQKRKKVVNYLPALELPQCARHYYYKKEMIKRRSIICKKGIKKGL